jgi:hypothetical protein
MARPKYVTCPICEEKFELEPDLEVGNMASCPSCYADLKILSLSPVEVEEANGVGDADDADDGFDGDDDIASDDSGFGKFR